jgi:hypothetical protein
MQTWTLMSSSLTSFRFRVLSTWNGRMHFFSRSHATASQSRIKDLVSGATHLCQNSNSLTWYRLKDLASKSVILAFAILSITSGYRPDMFSELRLYTVVFPSSSLWIYKYRLAVIYLKRWWLNVLFYLGSFAVIFEFAGELSVFKSVENVGQTLGWMSQHWLERNTCVETTQSLK